MPPLTSCSSWGIAHASPPPLPHPGPALGSGRQVASLELAIFSVVFSVIVLGFAMAFYMAFGLDVEGYRCPSHPVSLERPFIVLDGTRLVPRISRHNGLGADT